jgi:hypothetical protein
MGRGLLYLLAIVATAVMASGYVIGGLLAGASGFTSVVLAAAVPVAAMGWAITFATIQRDDRSRPGPGTGAGSGDADPGDPAGLRRSD